ncbi:hypothetical protein HDV05_001868 [Chytridiales sp. JEL 0842]|nr:hypothetical protein HDV05_001868 [Chytridiales sp. JEL 0842]
MFSGKRQLRTKISELAIKDDSSPISPKSPQPGPDEPESEPSTLPKEITDLMDSIRVHWDFMSAENFNAIPHALSLLDSSSVGLDKSRFETMFNKLEKAMDTIVNDLRKTPDKVESLINGKFYLTAVKNLIVSLKTLESDDFIGIGALETIRTTLLEVKSSLHEVLLDELHSHLYLKSPFSTDRIGKHYEEKDFKKSMNNIKKHRNSMIPTTQDGGSISVPDAIVEEPDATAAIKIIRERMPVELYYIVERTIQEVDQRYSIRTEDFSCELKYDCYRKPFKDKSAYSASFGSKRNDRNDSSLRKLLSLLFQKLETIVIGHQLILKIVNRAVKRKLLVDDGNIYTMYDVWSNVQNEVKALLYDYLTSSERVTDFGSTVVSINEILKEKKVKVKELRTQKQLFRISGSEPDKSLDDLYFKLNSEIGGAATNESIDPNDLAGFSTGIIDRYANVVTAGHRLLVVPDAYHVLAMYGPTVFFAEKVEEITGIKTGTFKLFLEDFVLNVFLPQMEDRVLEYFHNYVNGTDAFLTETAPGVANLPLVKSSLALTVLVQAMCRTLFAIPIHKHEVIRMIEMVLVKFYEKCLARFRSLMSGDKSKADYEGVGIISAGWACEDEIVQLLLQNTYFQNGVIDVHLNYTLAQKETYVEMALKKERSFHRNELIFEQRKLLAVANMHFSLDWFVAQISLLRVADRAFKRPAPTFAQQAAAAAAAGSSTSLDDYARLSSDSLPPLFTDQEDDVHLPLNNEMTARFDSILNYFQELSETYLFAFRVEIRCHAMYYLDLAMREGNYMLEEEPFEPDTYVDMLNQDLVLIEESVSKALPTRRIRFIFDGLSTLIRDVLMSNLRYVRRLNFHGVEKLLRNVMSLQQSLTNISAIHEKGLDRVKTYFELLNLSGMELVQFMESHPGKYSYDEYKVVLDLIFHDTMLEDYGHHQLLKQQHQRRQAKMKAPKGGRGGMAGGDDWQNAEVSLEASPSQAKSATSPSNSKQTYNECLEKLKKYFVTHN